MPEETPKQTTTASRCPRLSIGMPVYNSESWLAASIESILAQSLSDFELIISDNASTDRTYEICQQFAARDPRIRLLRNERNIGANRNYEAVLDAARGTYFKWASSNDLCAPAFLERCVAALERDPAAVLACPRTCIFENDLSDAHPAERDLELISDDPAARFRALLMTLGLNNAINGVIRREALQRAARMQDYMGADIVLLAELALMGKFLRIDEQLFFRRMSKAAATILQSPNEMAKHLVPTARGPLKFQLWRYHLGLLRATRFVHFPGAEWRAVLTYCLRAAFWSRSALAGDAFRSLRQAFF
jgi:glycosyltransferase involved in cell wall biosynthesis